MTQGTPPRTVAGLVDLACERVGGRAVVANDEFFAEKENLLTYADATFDPDRYTDHGKWMDGWETRRRRTPGHDWVVIALAAAGRIGRVVVDTSHFRGNHPAGCSIDACLLPADSGSKREVEQLAWGGIDWHEIVPRSPLSGHTRNEFDIADPGTFSHVRLNIHPDGGVARLRVYGEARPDWSGIVASGDPIDLASVLNGGRAVTCNDMFFSDQQNLLLPRRALNMGEGWETRRRREPGHDWVVVHLGAPAAAIDRVVVDTAYFKGNYPDACSLEVARVDIGDDEEHAVRSAGVAWREIAPHTRLEADREHVLGVDASFDEPPTHVRLNIFPDGGVSRLRVFGTPALVEERG